MSEAARTQLAKGRLGETKARTALHNRDEYRMASQTLAEQARRQLDIFTFDLDSPLYDQPAFIEAVKQLALRSRASRIRILLQDNLKVQQNGHRLLQLARRVPSRIEIRRPHIDYEEYPENFLIADKVGYIHRQQFSEYRGGMAFNDPLWAGRLTELFGRIWELSEQDSDLRQLNI